MSLGWTARALLTLDADANTMKRHSLPGAAAAPTFSPDGRKIAFELSNIAHSRSVGSAPLASEIAQLELSSSVVTQLTHNDWADRRPHFSADGATIHFEARNRDPVFGARRRVTRIASISVPR